MTAPPLQPGGTTTGARSPRARAAAAAGGARDYLVGLSRLDLLLAMTLIEVLLHTAGRATAVVSVLAILGLLYRPAARHPLFWLAVAGIILVATIVPSWETMFNHDWAIFYWALTLGIALWWRNPEDILAGSARLIIGLVFLFAVIWKAITPEFPNGNFFELTMLTDERFEVVGQIAGAPDGAAAAHREGIGAWRDQGLGAPPAVALESGSAVPAFAQFMAIWTLLIEGSIALLFLLPRRSSRAHRRDRAPALHPHHLSAGAGGRLRVDPDHPVLRADELLAARRPRALSGGLRRPSEHAAGR